MVLVLERDSDCEKDSLLAWQHLIDHLLEHKSTAAAACCVLRFCIPLIVELF